MSSILFSTRLIVLGGPGGVGKTTLSASIAAKLAAEGKKTLVLTIDPARRLAQVLGFENSKPNEVVPIECQVIEPAKLYATMLNSHHYFDTIVRDLATHHSQVELILKNPIYQKMVKYLGGTHEYAALHRLGSFLKDTSWDHIILDTPPSTNANDLFTAPSRLEKFFEDGVMNQFLHKTPKIFSTLLSPIQILGKFLGSSFMQSLTAFFSNIEDISKRLVQEQKEVLHYLTSDQSSFFMATTIGERSLLEVREYQQTLKVFNVKLTALLINRIRYQNLALNITSQNPLEKYLVELQQTELLGLTQFQKHFSIPIHQVTERASAPLSVRELLDMDLSS